MRTYLMLNSTVGGLRERIHGLSDATAIRVEGMDQWCVVMDEDGGIVIAPGAPLTAETASGEAVSDVSDDAPAEDAEAAPTPKRRKRA